MITDKPLFAVQTMGVCVAQELPAEILERFERTQAFGGVEIYLYRQGYLLIRCARPGVESIPNDKSLGMILARLMGSNIYWGYQVCNAADTAPGIPHLVAIAGDIKSVLESKKIPNADHREFSLHIRDLLTERRQLNEFAEASQFNSIYFEVKAAEDRRKYEKEVARFSAGQSISQEYFFTMLARFNIWHIMDPDLFEEVRTKVTAVRRDGHYETDPPGAIIAGLRHLIDTLALCSGAPDKEEKTA